MVTTYVIQWCFTDLLKIKHECHIISARYSTQRLWPLHCSFLERNIFKLFQNTSGYFKSNSPNLGITSLQALLIPWVESCQNWENEWNYEGRVITPKCWEQEIFSFQKFKDWKNIMKTEESLSKFVTKSSVTTYVSQRSFTVRVMIKHECHIISESKSTVLFLDRKSFWQFFPNIKTFEDSQLCVSVTINGDRWIAFCCHMLQENIFLPVFSFSSRSFYNHTYPKMKTLLTCHDLTLGFFFGQFLESQKYHEERVITLNFWA